MDIFRSFKKPAKSQKYADIHSFESRKKDTENARLKCPDKIPVICEVHDGSKHLIQLQNSKYLVSGDLSIGQFLMLIRKRITISPDQGVFLFNQKNELFTTSQLLKNTYAECKDTDGFLYFTLSVESTFG